MDIHFCWQQGIRSAPPVVRRNQRLWARLCAPHRLYCHDESAVLNAFRELKIDGGALSPQIRSDIFRLYLLQTRGGLWVDATVMPTPGVATWLSTFVEPLPHFLFQWPSGSQRQVISSWFIYAACPGSYLISQWLAALTRYFAGAPKRLAVRHASAGAWVISTLQSIDTNLLCRPLVYQHVHLYPYFILHYLYRWLRCTDDRFRDLAAPIPFVSAYGPHELQHYLRSTAKSALRPDPRRVCKIVDAHVLHKADWRVSEAYGTAQDYLEAQLKI